MKPWMPLALSGLFVVAGLAQTPKPGSRVDFAHDVEPILRAKCLSCHTAKSPAGGLSLETVEGVRKALIAGNPTRSELMRRIRGLDKKPQMPLGFAPLKAEEMARIEQWILQGAPGSTGRKTHWAFVRPAAPEVPIPSRQGWARNPIDAFVLARLEREGLRPSPEADRTTLIRRLTLDLTGLPPSPLEVDAFLADREPGAYERVVDRLLNSRHFGERMALPWLDAARYADSNGFQQDGDTYQWVWRDWVVRAYNTNMPFDRFTTEQLAGDLLPNPTLEQRIATAFNRNHMLNGEGGAIPEEQRNVVLYDRVDTTSTTWLALTMACARCHDHKYDPIPQRDFYRMMAYFNRVPESGVPAGGVPFSLAEPTVLVPSKSQAAELARLEEALRAAKQKQADTKKAEEEVNRYRSQIPRVMVMSDAQPRDTFVYHRGSYTEPTDKVVAAAPDLFGRDLAMGNRLDLARWIVSPQNPLTARVQVNRLWQMVFGTGIVKTSEDFGVQSEPPSHPELLDWLALRYQRSGWDTKSMLKLIVTSSTYRQTSRVTPELRRRDPENRLLARGARYRLPSMILRDVALASSGLLNREVGGPPVYPYQPEGIWDSLAITKERDFAYPQSKGRDLYRRSLYTFWRRTVAPANMFDSSSRQVCTVKATRTSTPLHALTMLNDVTWVEAGRALAASVMVFPTDEQRLKEAFRRVAARRPQPEELDVLMRMLRRARDEYRRNPERARLALAQGEAKFPGDPGELAALGTVCAAIYNLDEAMTRE